MSWQWRYPDELTIERRTEFAQAERRHRLLDVWPDTPLSDLDGQTPRQASANPGLRKRVLALILSMDVADISDASAQVFNELRQKLGLPIPESIDPKTVDLGKLPRVRLGRLQADKLSDDELIRCYRRASFPPQSRALGSLAAEIVRRPSFNGRPEVPEAYGVLAANSQNTTAALAFVEQGRAAAQRAKQLTAMWDIEELQLRLQRGEGDAASRLLQHVQREHAREPGVSEALFRLLYEAGVIDQQGRRIAAPQSQASPILVPGAAAPERSLSRAARARHRPGNRRNR